MTGLARAIIDTAQAMNASGVNAGTAGNVSARAERGGKAGFWITPTGLPYATLAEEDIAFVGLDGAAEGMRAPSSEWRFHRDLYAARPEFAAIVHTHSPCATALACQGLAIPAFHYMVAAAGGPDIRCADYATFGTQALSDAAVAALEGRRACLLAHHGVIAAGTSLARALALAIEVEHLARMYVQVRLLGTPRLLDEAEMVRVLKKFETYGQAGRSAD